jgi:hypothetical protein
VKFLRPPVKDEEATFIVCFLLWSMPEGKESREKLVVLASRAKEQQRRKLKLKEVGGGHKLHTCPSSTNESMFSNRTGNLPFSIS